MDFFLILPILLPLWTISERLWLISYLLINHIFFIISLVHDTLLYLFLCKFAMPLKKIKLELPQLKIRT